MRRKQSKTKIIETLVLLIYHLLRLLAEKQSRIDKLNQRLSEYEEQLKHLKEEAQNKEVSTPSGMKAVYEKPNRKRGRVKKPGCKQGHRGYRRGKPQKIDKTKDWTLEKCPICHNPLVPQATEIVIRYTEDIKLEKSETTEHRVERKYCSICDEIVTAAMTEALPKSQLGLNTLVISAWLHYFLGVTIGNLVSFFGITSLITVSKGYMSQAWRRLAEILKPYYEEIKEQARDSAVLNVDESGWRNNGVTNWLWCFTNKTLVFFTIERSRGSPVLFEILGELFNGVLVCDFYGAYNKIAALAKQRCIVHLLREIKKVSQRNNTAEWIGFAKEVKRLFKSAVLLGRDRDKLSPQQQYESQKRRLWKRLVALYSTCYEDKDCQRLAKRWLYKYRNELLTFLDYPDVDPDNNHAERGIRRPVTMRKNSYGNRSDRGVETQAIMMSIFVTLKMRGLNPIDFLRDALQEWIRTGKLPPLPHKIF